MVATPDEVDERALVEAARADPARFLDLYDRHFQRVYVYVLRRVGRSDGAVKQLQRRALERLRAHLEDSDG